jgi:hypothetical protein
VVIVVEFILLEQNGGAFTAGVSFAWKEDIKNPLKVGSVFIHEPLVSSYSTASEHLMRLTLDELPSECKKVLFKNNGSQMHKKAAFKRRLQLFAEGRELYFKRDSTAIIAAELLMLCEDAERRKSTVFADI